MSIKARDDFRDINRIDIDTEHPDVKCIKEIENFQNIGCFERSFPRLLNSREKIQMIRNSKKISNVFLNIFFKNPRTIWDNLPSSFEIFLKDNIYKKYLKDTEEVLFKFRSLGCDQMADHIEFNLNKIKNIFDNNYFGYKELSISNAAIILAKMHNFNLEDKVFSWKICCKKTEYKPKIFPIHYLRDIKTRRVTNLIKSLEEKPLFDHYFVIVPSYEKDGKNFSNSEILNKISRNDMIPVIMGERGFKNYFISYWT